MTYEWKIEKDRTIFQKKVLRKVSGCDVCYECLNVSGVPHFLSGMDCCKSHELFLFLGAVLH